MPLSFAAGEAYQFDWSHEIVVIGGKERAYNRRFQQMCGHYLVEPVACTPAGGWEKGQVENQVGVVRQRFFAPRIRAKSYEELNAWLLDRCVAWAKAHRHPDRRDQTIWEMFEAKRSSLVPPTGQVAFATRDGWRATGTDEGASQAPPCHAFEDGREAQRKGQRDQPQPRSAAPSPEGAGQ